MTPEERRARGLRAVLICHARGRGNTGPGLRAAEARFASEEDRRAFYKAIQQKSAESRRLKAEERAAAKRERYRQIVGNDA